MSPSSLIGAAGEHYVMSQLPRRGFIAALAPVWSVGSAGHCDSAVSPNIIGVFLSTGASTAVDQVR